MIIQDFGSVLVGFTKPIKCTHCNNEKPMQIRQYYVGQKVLFVPVLKAYKNIDMVCPICENKISLIDHTPMLAGQDKINNLIKLLEGGKDYTKHWVSTLEFNEQKEVLKRLNSLKAYEVVKYMGS